MMRSSEYWRERFKILEAAAHENATKAYGEIEAAFNRAQRQIQTQIDAWVQRVAVNNEVTINEARRMLNAKELAEFKWDVEEYIRHGRANAIDGKWEKELENASARFHVSKLEALKVRTQQALEAAFGKEAETLTEHLGKTFSNDYYHSIFEVQKGFGIGWEVGRIDRRKLGAIMSKPWAADGKNFSSRIWEKKSQMIGSLHGELARACIMGQTPDEVSKRLEKYVSGSVKNAKAAAKRLAYTETAFIHSASQKEAFKDLGVDRFEVVATLDSKTSDICQEMDGKVFDMKEYQPGTTAPPFHVHCRSVTAPYFDDDFGEKFERAARDENGKTYRIPANTTYPEWKKAFVDGGSKKGFGAGEKGDIISPMIDITSEWIKATGNKGSVSERDSYTVNGVVYRIDGKHVVLKPSEKEIEVARLLSEKYGKKVELVPVIKYPQGMQTPDYLIDGKRYDLKTIKSEGKNVLYNLVKEKKRQATNFIFDISKSEMPETEIIRQIKSIYASRHTRFVSVIVVIKNGEIKKIFRR